MVGAIESIRDMTERRQAEDAVFNEKEKLRFLSENAPFGMVLIESDGRFLYINPKFREIFGYDLNDVPDGRAWFRKAYPEDALRHEVIGVWKSDMADTPYGQQTQRVFNATCKDGAVKTINFTTVLLKDADKIMVCEDITEQKRLEKELLNAQKMQAIGTLSGGIAHDFNNILMGIQGYTSLIMLDVDPHDRQYERLKRIQEQVKSAAELTGQLLGFARGGKYVTQPVNLNELIEKTSTLFGRTKKEVAISCTYESDAWAVEADRGQIEQVFLNLYLNAWQAMPQGGDLYLQTRNVAIGESQAAAYSMAPGRYVSVSVRDTGMGMDEKIRERIFEPFFTTRELGRGTGLGLAMVYGIVKNHGGYIDVTSEPGKGATFTLYFPASAKDLAEEVPETGGIMKGRETILVVDDEPEVLTVNKEILKTLGYTVHGAKGGAEAVALYREMKGSISLVIVDMIMPGLSGSETFDRIRELNPSAKIILSSGYSLDGKAREIMNKGCDGFIQKPFDIAQISRKVRELLDK
jgi:PAS domain S-box-containing protein